MNTILTPENQIRAYDFSGAQLVATILGTPELYELWYVQLTSHISITRKLWSWYQSRLSEVKMMAERIIKMRDVLYDALIKLETPGKWDHIKSQIG